MPSAHTPCTGFEQQQGLKAPLDPCGHTTRLPGLRGTWRDFLQQQPDVPKGQSRTGAADTGVWTLVPTADSGGEGGPGNVRRGCEAAEVEHSAPSAAGPPGKEVV